MNRRRTRHKSVCACTRVARAWKRRQRQNSNHLEPVQGKNRSSVWVRKKHRTRAMKEPFADADDLTLETEWGDLEFDTDNGPQSVLFTRGGRSKLRENRAFSNETGRPSPYDFRARANMSDLTSPVPGNIAQRSMSNVDSVRANSKKKSTGGVSILGLRGKSSLSHVFQVETIESPRGASGDHKSPRNPLFVRSRTSGSKPALMNKLPVSSTPSSARTSKNPTQDYFISPVSSAGPPSSEKYGDLSDSFPDSGFTRSGSNNSASTPSPKTPNGLSRGNSKFCSSVQLTRTGGTKWYRDVVAVHTNAMRMEMADLESIIGHMIISPSLLSDRDVKLLYQWLKITRALTEQALCILISAIAKEWLGGSAIELAASLEEVRAEVMSAFDEVEAFKAAFLDPNRDNVLDELQVPIGELIMCMRSLIRVAETEVADAIRFHMSAEDIEEGDEIVRSCIARGDNVKSGMYISFLLRWMRSGEDAVWFERIAGRGRMEKAKLAIAKSNFEKYHTFIPGRFSNKYGGGAL
ncbi:hypothetical protein FVE85_9494 [Porphyridium purpureum]|uniref:Uncharacterized protein n=1 Tax=Porphyridium purpureum TaxID=35688 RepID=A0A5J4YIJ1_PORPP|nr:hypothetical protein FVE85_9494 [Porphyridium purpureum]|eukprot:POR4734..scf261_15